MRKGIGTTLIPSFLPSSGVIPEPESVQIPIFMPTPLYCQGGGGSSPLAFFSTPKIRLYFSKRLFPVISLGCGIPISSKRVGATSARHPPSLNLCFSSLTKIKGTGFVVCAV